MCECAVVVLWFLLTLLRLSAAHLARRIDFAHPFQMQASSSTIASISSCLSFPTPRLSCRVQPSFPSPHPPTTGILASSSSNQRANAPTQEAPTSPRPSYSQTTKKMGGRLSDRLQGLLLEYHATLPTDAMDALLDDDQDQASSGGGGEDLSIFLCHLVLHRRRLPSALLLRLSELLVPPYVSSEHATLLQAMAGTHPDARLSSPRHLRTLLLTLGTHAPHPPLPSSMHHHLLASVPPPPPTSPTKSNTSSSSTSTHARHRAALTRAITREMDTWGLADDYFHFPSSSSPSSSSTGGPASSSSSSTASASAATRNSIRLNYVPRPQRGFTVAVWFSFDAEERGGEGERREGGKEGGGFTLFRFQSHHHSKKDTSVEATLESWGEDSWQLVYR